MTSSIQLVLTAMASLAVGAAGTYATVNVVATCNAPQAPIDHKMKAFLAPPDQPLSGYTRY